LLDDRDLTWDVRALSIDDAIAAINAEPLLAPHRELIIDRAGLHSVSPRLLSVLLKYNEQIAAADTADVARVRFLVDAAIAATSKFFYEGRRLSGTVTESTSGNAEILAIDPAQRGLYAIASSLATTLPSEARMDTIAREYVSRFGTPQRAYNEQLAPGSAVVSPAAAPANFLRLPWLVGQTGWSFNGVHSTTGGCPSATCGSPRSSIDFSRGWPVWGTNTADARVLAMHGGTVTVFSSCNIRVTDSASGWATNYYHLSNLQISNGATVYAGQWIANYADNSAQALCQGGSSTGPHTHVTLIQSGSQVDLHLSEMSGWRVNAEFVTRDYDSDCSRMNLTRSSITACAYQGSNPAAWGMHTLPANFPSNTRCAFDVDGNNNPDPATDGVLLLRYALGFRGANLITGAVGAGATRNTAPLIENYLSVRPYDFNVDDLSRTLSDQLIAIRLMRGVTGTALTASLGVTTGLLTTPTSILEFSRGCR
jgi:LasA protease